MTPERMKEIIADARARAAIAKVKVAEGAIKKPTGFQWNAAQQQAIDFAQSGKDFCLIGAAGTGKTTTLKGLIKSLLEANKIPMLQEKTKHLIQGTPGIALVSYTRRAVRNIAKVMPEEIRNSCMTVHKLIEFEPTQEDYVNSEGVAATRMRFMPARTRLNPLPATLKLIVVDESSMVSEDLFNSLLDALPNPSAVSFIFLGDLNQLPPVYGVPILAKKLIELPIVELTEVYRQALDSPIISLATDIRTGVMKEVIKTEDVRTGPQPSDGKVTIKPWKKKCDPDDGLNASVNYLRNRILAGSIDFDEAVVLCPFNKAFGTVALNKGIAQAFADKEKKIVWEVIAGFNKHYFSVGDKLLVNKMDAVITEITPNPLYLGHQPQQESIYLTYYGTRKDHDEKQAALNLSNSQQSAEDMLEAMVSSDVEDRKAQASHTLKVCLVDDGKTVFLKTASDINTSDLAYAMSCHKSQGSEWSEVIFITHGQHSKMLSRELVYTAVTRAKNELVIIGDPGMLMKSAMAPRIKGVTLADKLEFLKSKFGN